MIKGLLGSLIAAIVLFTAGGITVALFGTYPYEYSELIEELEWNGGSGTLNERFTGERTWYFNELSDITELRVETSGAKTYIAPSKDGLLVISAQSNDRKEILVEAEFYDGKLRVAVGGHEFRNFIFDAGNNGTVMISVPDTVYERLTVDVGSGSLAARGIGAKDNMFDVGSGSFEFEQKSGFAADHMELDMGSGSVRIGNADARSFKIDMGSGTFNVSGLTGSGEIFIGSGSGTAEFSKIDPEYAFNRFNLGSGKLSAFIPGDTKGDLQTDIGSGVVSVNCCGVSKNIYDDTQIPLGGGSDGNVTFFADLGSGKVELRDRSEYNKPDMFGEFPAWEFSVAAAEQIDVIEATVVGGENDNSGSVLIGSVTYAEFGTYKSDLDYATGYIPVDIVQ